MINDRIEDDLYLLMGETYHSNSTAFINGPDLLNIS